MNLALLVAISLTLSACGQGADDPSSAGPSRSSASAAGEVTEQGFRLDVAVDGVPVKIEGPAAVADPGTRVEVAPATGTQGDALFADSPTLPGIEVTMADGGQPRAPIRITYDLSERSDVLDALGRGFAPVVVSDEGSADRGLVLASVDTQSRTFEAETSHLSSFRAGAVDLTGRYTAAFEAQEARRAGLAATERCPEPDGVNVAGTRVRAQSSQPEILDACATGADGDAAVIELTNSSPLFFALSGIPSQSLSTGSAPDTAATLASLVNAFAQGEAGPSLVPPGSTMEVRYPVAELPGSIDARVDPAATQYETVLTGLDMLGVRSDLVRTALDSKSAMDCMSAGADTARQPDVDFGTGVGRFATFGDCILKVSTGLAGETNSAAVQTVGTALTLIGTLPRQLTANVAGLRGEFSGTNQFDISLLTGDEAAPVDRDPEAPGLPGDQKSPDSGPGWYWLSDMRPTSSANGYGASRGEQNVIKNTTYPNSFIGSYTTGRPFGDMNRASYMLAGKCSTLDMYVGQSSASPRVGGPTRFRIWLNDDNLVLDHYAEINAEAHHVRLDVSGASRMTFQDDRERQAGYNVWGSPRMYCTENPRPDE